MFFIYEEKIERRMIRKDIHTHIYVFVCIYIIYIILYVIIIIYYITYYIYIIPNLKKIGVVRFQNMKILPTIKSSFYHDRVHKRYNPTHVYNKTL